MIRSLLQFLLVMITGIATATAGMTPCRCDSPAASPVKSTCCHHKPTPAKPCCGQCVVVAKNAVITHPDFPPVDLSSHVPLVLIADAIVWQQRQPAPAPFHPPPPDILNRYCRLLI